MTPGATASLAIEAREISKRFTVKESGQIVHALDAVTLSVPHGGLTALVGPDGAGKTTFLRLVAGLMHADSGSLTVLDADVRSHPQQIQNRISYMPQRFGLYEDLSVQENLDLYADLHGVPAQARRERFDRLLSMTDLARFTDRPAGKLSGGMKQKLGLACTLVRSPDLLLLDEPTVGVDPLSRRELWQIVHQLVEDDKLSVLITTAYLDEAERCDHVYVLHQGRVLTGGVPGQIAAHAQRRCFIVAPPADEPARHLQARLLDEPACVIDAVPHAGDVRFIQRQPDSVPDAVTGLAVREVPARLEDGFMMLLRTQASEDAGHPATEAQRPMSRNTAHSATGPAQPPVADPDIARRVRDTRQPVIEVRDLVRRFGTFTAVDRTTFSVNQGEIFGLLGPNGAGKTTTFRMLCGLLPASSGEAHVAGMDMRRARAQARGRIGYVAQKFALYGDLSTWENLRFFGGAYGLHGARLRARIDAVLAQFDLQEVTRTPAGHLAGGIKQRLAMAVGLLHEPDILFLDEPTSGADPLARRSFWRRITDLAGTGTTIVITTHFMEEAEYCDRIVIQDAGRLLALGTPEAVRRQAGETNDNRFDMEQAFIGIVQRGRRERAAQEARA